MLGEVAWAAARSKGSYPHAWFQRVARRRGRPKALLAVAHSLLRSSYCMLRDRQPYRDLAPTTSIASTPSAWSASMSGGSSTWATP